MLTRLQVNGFKNLVGVDVHFGPFTCIAGANGVGKSNLFDAIRFLSALADRTVHDAALSVRDDQGRAADVRGIFHRMGDTYLEEMSFEAEFIVPGSGVDDLGQQAEAAITFLRYELVLGLRPPAQVGPLGPIEIRREVLTHIPLGRAYAHLHFPHAARTWRKSAVTGRRTAPNFISTTGVGPSTLIRVHADSGSESGGRPLSRSAANLPRTVLSVANAAESRTALLARKEMQAWRLLQLEPSALRKPDDFTAPIHLGADGSHMPATLFHLAKNGRVDGSSDAGVYTQIANRLALLIDDVRDLRVERDERRELLTLVVTGGGGTAHSARSLSDGTLRFLALAILELEPEGFGLICLEEPENGIHPKRIPAMLRLLQDIAVDTGTSTGPDNPLRQVVINTHSPVVVSYVPDDALLIAGRKEVSVQGRRSSRVVFSPLAGTWRSEIPDGPEPASRGDLLDYLNPLGMRSGEAKHGTRRPRRVMDRPDMQMLLPFESRAG